VLCFLAGVGMTSALLGLMPTRGGASLRGQVEASARLSNAPPWGRLERIPITLERPDESFVDTNTPVPPTTWFFGQHSQAEVRAHLSAPDLPPALQRQLLDGSRWTGLSNGWLLHPPADAVIALSPEARHRLYGLLRQYPENPLHRSPIRIPQADFDRWLAECGLPADKQALFRQLTWVEGNTVLFADFEVLEARCTVAERMRLAKSVARSPGLLLNLRLDASTDVDALLRYWGRGRRAQAMKPFLEALTRVPGGATVSSSFLFPPFARTRLFTYPDPKTDRLAARQDCLWTSMNFFNDRPDNRFFDGDFIRRTLDTQYVRVATNWVFGDVLLLLDGAGETLHMCVFVAEDVVFTKNGLDPIEPWRLMTLADMLAIYNTSTNGLHLAAFRRKDL
jgi:hypothetical protein